MAVKLTIFLTCAMSILVLTTGYTPSPYSCHPMDCAFGVGAMCCKSGNSAQLYDSMCDVYRAACRKGVEAESLCDSGLTTAKVLSDSNQQEVKYDCSPNPQNIANQRRLSFQDVV